MENELPVDVVMLSTDTVAVEESGILRLPAEHRAFGSKVTVKIDHPELLRDSVFDYVRSAVQQSDHRE